MKERLREYDLGAHTSGVQPLNAELVDPRYTFKAPEGGLVVRVQAKVLDGYQQPNSSSQAIFQSAISRDNLWITQSEHESLLTGKVPRKLAERIARFHLVDNTRGEPPMWKKDEIRSLEMKLNDGELTGSLHLETADGQRGYVTNLRGKIEVDDDQVRVFDIVSLGEFWGEGRFTRNAPEGRFPLVVTFRLADGSDVADPLPPQGARGWVDGYLKN